MRSGKVATRTSSILHPWRGRVNLDLDLSLRGHRVLLCHSVLWSHVTVSGTVRATVSASLFLVLFCVLLC